MHLLEDIDHSLWHHQSKKRVSPQWQQVLQCLWRKLEQCKHSAQLDALNNDQDSLLPRTIADEVGYTHKATKSHLTDKLQNLRYLCWYSVNNRRHINQAWLETT